MDLGLAGKTVVVVGGSSNLGRSCCLAFAKEGSNVVVVARHAADCEKVVDKCNATGGGGTSLAISMDATKLDQCEELGKEGTGKARKNRLSRDQHGMEQAGLFSRSRSG